MEQVIAKLQELLAVYGMGVLGAIIILIVGRIVASILRSITERVMTKSKVETTLVKFVGNLVYAGIIVFAVVAAMSKLGVQTASFVAVIGAAGLAVGFALQGSLSNFAAGVLLIVFRPIKVGDFVEAGGATGVVDNIDIFTTTLTTPDNKKIIVPNSGVMGGNITNYSALGTRRVDLVFGIGYGDDIPKAKALLEKLLADDERVLKDPAPSVGVLELADSSVNFAVRPWVRVEDYWSVYFDITEKVKLAFDEAGISIPFPQQDVHMFQTSA